MSCSKFAAEIRFITYHGALVWNRYGKSGSCDWRFNPGVLQFNWCCYDELYARLKPCMEKHCGWEKPYWFKTRLQQGSTVYLFFYMTYIYIHTRIPYAYIIYWHKPNSCNSEHDLEHEFWHEGEHKKAQSRARFVARRRAPKSTI